ncbi:MAG TPA: TAXI family TRAP transporter solute-binding subunit, partial [Candidatus Binatia bacterium]|nr:TAXI family TRAP transporter solute-binding subunit [Candidatus Binatia bacterium]
IPLRAIGVFPTWDRLIFAVRKDSGIQSLEDIKKQKYPLRISTRRKGKLQTTLYAIEEVLKAYGMRLSDVEHWGGKVMEAASPSSQERLDAIRFERADAVFDEGVKSWGAAALGAGMRFLPVNDEVLRKMEKIGFPSATLTRKHYPKMDRDIRTVDFSGWTFFCHADLPANIAYNMAKAVDLCYKQIPVDHFDKRPMTMREFCRGGEAGQLNIPLHPGAKKYFKEKGYL